MRGHCFWALKDYLASPSPKHSAISKNNWTGDLQFCWSNLFKGTVGVEAPLGP